MPTINGHPYHLTASVIPSFYNEPSTFSHISPDETTMTLSMARQRAAALNSTASARSGTRHTPRIPRLRRPLVTDNLTDNGDRNTQTPPTYNIQHMSISSAISTTAAFRSTGAASLTRDQCLDIIDFDSLLDNIHDYSSLTKQHENDYSYLDFRLKMQNCSSSSVTAGVEKLISYEHGVIYRIMDGRNTADMDLEFVSHRCCCVVSQVVIKSPQTGYSQPCRDGMIFISHCPFSLEETQQFSHFTKSDYDRYQEASKRDATDDRVAAWFRIVGDQPVIVDLNERSGRYILIKLFPCEHESNNLDLVYVAFLGYVGPRSFGKSQLY